MNEEFAEECYGCGVVFAVQEREQFIDNSFSHLVIDESQKEKIFKSELNPRRKRDIFKRMAEGYLWVLGWFAGIMLCYYVFFEFFMEFFVKLITKNIFGVK
ncbi:hypothetical protein QUF90_24230 [Desulfococcaceae bacterium HSG9]|nr:hypothetical protein [Desulfococcaceae bacterium HSG9]